MNGSEEQTTESNVPIMEKKIKITTANQFEILIAELENKPHLAKGFHKGANPDTFKQEWEDITEKLNSIGPPVRDSNGWQKVWKDFKCKVKRKLMRSITDTNATGEGNRILVLSHLEETVANLMQLQQLLNPEGEVQGLLQETSESEINVFKREISEDDEENMQSTSAYSMQAQVQIPLRKRRRQEGNINDSRHELLQNHSDMQKEILQEISKTMIDIKNVFKETSQHQQEFSENQENTLLDIKNTLKETSEYQRKLCEIEEKKMKMMERQHQREELRFSAEMQLLELKIEMKNIKIKKLRSSPASSC